MKRKELTEEQWRKLVPLLPPQKPQHGHPARDHRIVINTILWVPRTRAPWRDLPEHYGPWRTAASRSYRWHKAGVWQRVSEEFRRQEDRS